MHVICSIQEMRDDVTCSADSGEHLGRLDVCMNIEVLRTVFHFCCSLLALMTTNRGVAHETIFIYFKKLKMSKQTFICHSENNAGGFWKYLCTIWVNL